MYMPDDFQRGIQGRCAEVGVRKLDAKYRLQSGILISMDFSLCFDYVNPCLSLRVLQRMDAPQRLLSLLEHTEHTWMNHSAGGSNSEAPLPE